jgi:hypothetical protein
MFIVKPETDNGPPAATESPLKRAFQDSVAIATEWNDLVNHVFGAVTLRTPAFDRVAIRLNALCLTPLLWAARKIPRAAKSETAQAVPRARGPDPHQPV